MGKQDWPFFGSSVLFQLHIPLPFFHHHRQPTSNNNHELFLRSVPLGTVRVPEVRAPLLPRVRQGRARGARVLSRLYFLYLFSLYLPKGEGEGVAGLFEWDNGVANPDDEATKDDRGCVHSVTEKGGRRPPRRVLQ